MNKLVAFFLVMLVGMSILSSVMEGGGGMVTTELTADITTTNTTIPVTTTNNFLSADYIDYNWLWGLIPLGFL